MDAPGSSPLARGLPGSPAGPEVVGGIIPARAGFTQPPSLRILRHTDHPRSRGVYKSKRWGSPTNVGSSPLARGLPLWVDGGGEGGGIIPARAGFTPPFVMAPV